MSTAPTTPHTPWSFTHWLQGKERMLGQLRWWITIIALLALAIGGPLLSGSITPVVTDRDNQCAYNAAEDTPPVFADVAEAGQPFILTWAIRNSGTCNWGDGVAFVRVSDQIPSDQNKIQIGPQSQPAAIRLLHLTTPMKAMPAPGLYETQWQLRTPGNLPFGPAVTRYVLIYPPGAPPVAAPLNQPPLTPLSILLSILQGAASMLYYALPALLAMFLVLRRGNEFLIELYNLRAPASGRKHIMAMLFGQPRYYLRVHQGQLEYDAAHAPAAIIGGPAWLLVAEHNAALIERGAKFSRIVGPGYTFLRSHERVRGAVDLQIQQRRSREKSLTKDGIPVELDVDLIFRITEKNLTGDAPPEPPPPLRLRHRIRKKLGLRVPTAFLEASKPHRFSREAVRRAIYETAIASPDQAPDWTRSFAGVRAGDVSEQLAEKRLDELSSPDDPDLHPMREMVDAGLEAARKIGATQGIDLIDVHAGVIEMPDDIKKLVEEQRIDNWQVEWRRRARQLKAEGEARALQSMEEARAEAQANMIQALTEGFRIATADDPNATTDVIAMRFIDAMETLIQPGPEVRPPAAERSGQEERIEKLESMLNRMRHTS